MTENSGYTPTTEGVKASRRGGWHPDSIPGRNADAEFERWLSAHDAALTEKVIEVAKNVIPDDSITPMNVGGWVLGKGAVLAALAAAPQERSKP